MKRPPSAIQAGRFAAVLALACAPLLRADEISLKEDDSRLSGTVSAITPGGAVQLDSPLSAEPLLLRAGTVRRVQFDQAADAPPPGDTRLTLAGGDVLPCFLRSLDDNTLAISTPAAGDLSIPRSAAATLELGIHPSKVLYAGPDEAESWTTDSWKFQNSQFSCTGDGRLSRPCELPDRFILRFRLAWKGSPKIQVYFADPLQKDAPYSDRYYLQFNSSGMEVKRESSKGANFTSLLTAIRPPESFPRSRMDVEIRVDRTTSKLWLYIDGNLEEKGSDPRPVPKGGGLAFVVDNHGQSSAEYTLSDVKILSWDPDGDRHRTGQRGDHDKDTLIDSEGTNYFGHLGSIKPGEDGGTVFSFVSHLEETPQVIPSAKVSTIFFKDPATPPPQAPATTLVLLLQGGGSLKVESCIFSGDHIEVKHPLLGTLSLKRGSVASIEQATPPASKE